MLGRRNLELGLSTMMVSSRMKFLVLAMAAGLLLSACGKRGPLEAPPATGASQSQPQAQGETAGTARGELRPKRTPILPPKRDLLIDRLLD
jgi:predicted small lipoprotein YifL